MTDKAPAWKKGQSGNPKGRPKGSRNTATLLAIAALEGELSDVVRVVIEAAKGGDMAAARLVVDKLIPATRERPISIDLPCAVTVEECAAAQAKVHLGLKVKLNYYARYSFLNAHCSNFPD